MKELKKYRYYLLIALLGCILYGNTIRNGFSLDDAYVTKNNPQVQKGFSGIPELFTSFYSDAKGIKFGYRPIVKVTYAVEYEIFGKNPNVSHLFNLILYILTGILLFRLLSDKLMPSLNKWFFLLVVFIFMAHPVHTEVVASLKNRDELLSFLFALLSMYFVFKYFDQKKPLLLVYSVVLIFLGYLSKPDAMVFVVLIPLTLYFFRDIKLKSILFVSGIMILTALLARYFPNWILPKPDRAQNFIENPLFQETNFLVMAGTGMVSLLFYMKMLFYPHPLLFYYGYDTIPVVDIFNFWAIVSVIIHLALFVIALKLIRKKHLISYGILFYLVSISMFSNILKPAMGIVAERYMFGAVLGFALIAAWFIFKLAKVVVTERFISKRSFSSAAYISLILIIPFSLKTIIRNTDWKNEITLYSNDIEYLEKSARANELYASTLLLDLKENKKLSQQQKIQQTNKIIFHYKRTLEIYPKYSNVWNNLGSVYFEIIRDNKMAHGCFYNAVQLNPDYEKAIFNYAQCSELLNLSDTAEFYYKKALTLDPYYKHAYSALGNFYYKQGKLKKAIKVNETMAEKIPDTDIPYVNIGKYYLSLKDTATAVSYLEKAIEIRPDNYNLCVNLYNFFRMNGNAEKAEFYRKKAEAAK